MIHIICSWNAPKSKKIQLIATFFQLKKYYQMITNNILGCFIWRVIRIFLNQRLLAHNTKSDLLYKLPGRLSLRSNFRHRKPEHRPLALFTLHPDVATIFLNKLFAENQTESGTFFIGSTFGSVLGINTE